MQGGSERWIVMLLPWRSAVVAGKFTKPEQQRFRMQSTNSNTNSDGTRKKRGLFLCR